MESCTILRRRAGFAVFALCFLVAWPRVAGGQGAEDEYLPGPTREALMATALRMSATDAPPPDILPRYRAFADEFEAHFGAGRSMLDDDDFLAILHQRLQARFGDTSIYGWVQRGLFFYARAKAFTEVERKGFNMQIEMDDMAEGKVGVRVNRTLE